MNELALTPVRPEPVEGPPGLRCVKRWFDWLTTNGSSRISSPHRWPRHRWASPWHPFSPKAILGSPPAML